MERLKSVDIAIEYATKRTDKRLKMNAAKFLATQDLKKVRGAIESLLRDDDRDVREVTLTALLEGSVDKPENYRLTRLFYPWQPLTRLSLMFLGFLTFCVVTAFLLWFIPPNVVTTPDAWLLIVLKHFGLMCLLSGCLVYIGRPTGIYPDLLDAWKSESTEIGRVLIPFTVGSAVVFVAGEGFSILNAIALAVGQSAIAMVARLAGIAITIASKSRVAPFPLTFASVTMVTMSMLCVCIWAVSVVTENQLKAGLTAMYLAAGAVSAVVAVVFLESSYSGLASRNKVDVNQRQVNLAQFGFAVPGALLLLFGLQFANSPEDAVSSGDIIINGSFVSLQDEDSAKQIAT